MKMPKPKELHCYCRREDDGSFMIYCENCRIWFHGECVNTTKKASKRIAQWFCVWCTTHLRAVHKTTEEHKQLVLNVSKIQDELNQLKTSLNSRNQEKTHEELVHATKEQEVRDIAEQDKRKNQDLSARIQELEKENEHLLQEIAGGKSKCEEISSILGMNEVQSANAIALLQQEIKELQEKLHKSTSDQENKNGGEDPSTRIRELEEVNEKLLGERGSLNSKCAHLDDMLKRVRNKSRLSLQKKLQELIQEEEEEEEFLLMMEAPRIAANDWMEMEEGLGLDDLASWEHVTVNIDDYHNMNDGCFRLHFRMSKNIFETLVVTIEEHLRATGRLRRVRTPLRDIVLMVVWLLATPDTFRSVALRFGVHPSTLYYFYSYIIMALRELAP